MADSDIVDEGWELEEEKDAVEWDAPTFDAGTGPLVVECVVEPTTPADREQLAAALPQLAAADRSLRYVLDAGTGHATLRSTSEGRLTFLAARLREEFGVGLTRLRSRAVYLEGTGAAATWVKGTADGAQVTLTVEPLAEGGYVFADRSPAGRLPAGAASAVDADCREQAAQAGPWGFAATDLRVTLTDGEGGAEAGFAAAEVAALKKVREAFNAARGFVGPFEDHWAAGNLISGDPPVSETPALSPSCAR
ncbi:hypothetical protein [Streptomyces sp. NPDC048445]|uniref:hypothetical protein n=1 Tax=Streptomyces sp. NPDC048445 TaxID=3365553 RepID=UPI003714FEB5